MRNTVSRPLLAALAAITGPAVSQAGTFKTLHQFTNYPTDGAYPMGDLTVLNDQLYGTTSEGGLGYGVIFEIDPTTGTETVFHALGGLDGYAPYAGLLAWHGKLYGTSLVGGAYGEGSVFETDPATGNTILLHSFFGDDGNDGADPEGALIAYKGKLYGTTQSGGGLDEGTVFVVDPKTKAEGVYYFEGGSGGADPISRLLERNGILYGTCLDYPGNIFSIDPETGKFTIVLRFNDNGIASPADGLTADGDTFYGTSVDGNGGQYDLGSVFSFKLSNAKLKQVHAFGRKHRDGKLPVSDLILVNGTLYGTASEGGKSGQGIVFGINIATKAETILHEFTGGGDGGDPVAGLVFYNGALYGTTYSGALGYGTVFEVKP